MASSVITRFLSKLILHALSLWAIVLSTEVIYRDNGCPYPFDFGTLGYSYVKPNICDTLMSPLWDKKSPPSNKYYISRLPIWMELKYFEDMMDVYRLDIWVSPAPMRNKSNVPFRMMDFLLRVYEVNPDGSLGGIAGHFERKDDFEPYCCDDIAKRRNMIRFVNVKKQRPSKTFVRWAPLSFTGNIKFIGNFFESSSNYVVNVSSAVFKIPLYHPHHETSMAYDEDWGSKSLEKIPKS